VKSSSSLAIPGGSTAWAARLDLTILVVLLCHLSLSIFQLSVIVTSSLRLIVFVLLISGCWLGVLGVPWLDVLLFLRVRRQVWPSWRHLWSWRKWVVVNLFLLSEWLLLMRNAVNNIRLRDFCRFLLVNWFSQNLILSYWRSCICFLYWGDKLRLDQSLRHWFISMLKFQ
jgi:hypothetical protein